MEAGYYFDFQGKSAQQKITPQILFFSFWPTEEELVTCPNDSEVKNDASVLSLHKFWSVMRIQKWRGISKDSSIHSLMHIFLRCSDIQDSVNYIRC